MADGEARVVAMTIVVYAHRRKRPAKKQKASALERAAKAAAPTKALPAIVKPTSETRLRMERAMQASGEPSPEIDAFFARNVRRRAALPPPRKP